MVCIFNQQDSGSVTELELLDVAFLDNKFPKNNAVGFNRYVYELQDQVKMAMFIRVREMIPQMINWFHFPDSPLVEANIYQIPLIMILL